jgi:large subunit ribosomal protein L29
MKKNELTKLRNKKETELAKLINEKKLALAKTKAELGTGSEKNLKKVKNLKRDVAQMKTLLKEKEIISKLERKKED